MNRRLSQEEAEEAENRSVPMRLPLLPLRPPVKNKNAIPHFIWP